MRSGSWIPPEGGAVLRCPASLLLNPARAEKLREEFPRVCRTPRGAVASADVGPDVPGWTHVAWAPLPCGQVAAHLSGDAGSTPAPTYCQEGNAWHVEASRST